MKKSKKAAALKYDKYNDVPIVTASGMGYVAEEIIERANKSDIPVVLNPELAESLSRLSLGEEIPEELYDVVACILAYIYNLKA